MDSVSSRTPTGAGGYTWEDWPTMADSMGGVEALGDCCFHCRAAVSGVYALEASVSWSVSSSKARTKALGEAGDMGKDVKVSGSGLGDVGGEESEMDLWDAVSLSSKKSSSSARGFGFSVKGFFESEKPSLFMISKCQEMMVMAACRCQLVSSISAVAHPTPLPQPLQPRRLSASVLFLFLFLYLFLRFGRCLEYYFP